MPSRQLEKWHAYRILCPEYAQVHHQLVICVCPVREWFLFINSEPPVFRKAREAALELSNFEASFLSHISFVNPLPQVFPDNRVTQEIAIDANCFGQLSPTLITRIKGWIEAAPVLNDDQKAIIIAASIPSNSDSPDAPSPAT